MDLALETEQRTALERVIVPGVRRAPGVVSGQWTLDRANNESVVIITYDSLDAAQAMATSIGSNGDNQKTAGLALVSVRIVEVLAAT